jgi:aryl-alcohol dehydrogenase-like predicted oxidoreductase
MDFTTLGRSGLKTSVAGLGCGGHSRLGQSSGASAEQSADVVRAALDLGINFIDTAAAYGTEGIVGEALKGRREQAVISTKIQVIKPGTDVLGNDFKDPGDLKADLEKSLLALQTDYVDICHLHGVMPDQYAWCAEHLVPVLKELQSAGKVRFLGLTERFIYDPSHEMLDQALLQDHWDVIMTGFNLINPSARHQVFPKTLSARVGTLLMFAVRRALSQPEALKDLISGLIAEGLVAGDDLNPDRPLDFLLQDNDAGSVVEAAYRFCRHEPGVDIVLTGTGSIEHLGQNIRSILKGPLSETSHNHLARLFGHINTVSGN